jgi:DNA-binding NarL/FixJ family response regulator
VRLGQEPWVEICAVTSSIEDVPELIFEHRPHLLITNVAPQCSNGMASIKKLKRDFIWIKILAFSCSSEFEDMHAGMALDFGADGYVSSADTSKELISAIRTISQGRQYISPQAKLYRKRVKTSVPGFTALSRREAEVFCLTGCGYVTRSIAEMMNLKEKTVDSYRERIRKKLHIQKASDLLYTSVSFMRSAARRGMDGMDDLQMIRELLSAKA